MDNRFNELIAAVQTLELWLKKLEKRIATLEQEVQSNNG